MSAEGSRAILLVEDNDNDIELTLLALQRAGVQNPIHVVRDGVEALDYLRCTNAWSDRAREHPAVILLDKKLPRLDGHEVLDAIKRDEQLQSVPVVMLTSSRLETDLLRSYDLGVNAYVVKPVEFNDFMDAIKDVGAFWLMLNRTPPPLPGVSARARPPARD
jgi:CheY-like chemotaxis protein